ncbi:MAG TPA: sialate O-acetylesterase [Spirochaetota bacterium]|nr:sialate O-acetylesterase [Spirochaetota bacterium]
MIRSYCAIILSFGLLVTCKNDAAAPDEKTAFLLENKVRVFIFAGQSNMEGQAGLSELAVALRPVPANSMTFYYALDELDLDPAALDVFYHATKYTHGPEAGFGHSITNLLAGEEIIIIKYSKGSTTLAVDWNADSGSLYTNLVTLVNNVLGGTDYQLCGLMWLQGESDAYNMNQAAAYYANLTNFITSLRTDLHVSSLPFFIGATDLPGTNTAWEAEVSNAQTAAAANDPDVVTFSTAAVNSNRISGDAIHYNSQGLVKLGQLFADNFITWLNRQ